MSARDRIEERDAVAREIAAREIDSQNARIASRARPARPPPPHHDPRVPAFMRPQQDRVPSENRLVRRNSRNITINQPAGAPGAGAAPVVIRNIIRNRRERSRSSSRSRVGSLSRSRSRSSSRESGRRIGLARPRPATVNGHAAERAVDTNRAAKATQLDITKSNDITIHLELGVSEDIEPQLQSFWKLSRLGRFKEAKHFFRCNLQSYTSHPYVLLQYAQMLLNMGDYKGVEALQDKSPCSDPTLQKARQLIAIRAAQFTGRWKGSFDFIIDDIEKWSWRVLRQAGRTSLDSTTTQILSLLLLVSNDLERQGVFDWNEVYQHLETEGRMWDFRDLFIAYLDKNSESRAFSAFLGRSEPSNIWEFLQGGQQGLGFDAPHQLALLDVLASASHHSTLTVNDEIGQYLFDRSHSMAVSIASNDADLLMSRPYLRWGLAKIRSATLQAWHDKQCFEEYPGLVFFEQGLPLYAAKYSEAIDWPANALPSHANEKIQVVLDAARKLEDYDTESVCLKMLVLRSEDPLKYLDALGRLQKTVQHDMRGYLATTLFKYALCKDDRSREQLRSQILDIKCWGEFPSIVQWIRLMVLRAVSDPFSGEKLMTQAAQLHDGLPAFVLNWVYELTWAIPTSDEILTRGRTELSYDMVDSQALDDSQYPYIREGRKLVLQRALKPVSLARFMRPDRGGKVILQRKEPPKLSEDRWRRGATEHTEVSSAKGSEDGPRLTVTHPDTEELLYLEPPRRTDSYKQPYVEEGSFRSSSSRTVGPRTEPQPPPASTIWDRLLTQGEETRSDGDVSYDSEAESDADTQRAVASDAGATTSDGSAHPDVTATRWHAQAANGNPGMQKPAMGEEVAGFSGGNSHTTGGTLLTNGKQMGMKTGV